MFRLLERFQKLERIQRLSIIFGSLIVVGLLFVAIGVLSAVKVTPFRTYTNTKAGVSIQFPAYWKPVVNPEGGALVAFVSPQQDSLDIFSDNLNVSIKHLSRPMTQDYVSRMIVSQVSGTFGEYVDITQSVPIKLGGRPGYRLTFTGFSQNVKNPVMYVTAWTIVGDRLYVVAFTGLEKDYPLHRKNVDAMIRSFKFIPVENP